MKIRIGKGQPSALMTNRGHKVTTTIIRIGQPKPAAKGVAKSKCPRCVRVVTR